MGTQSTPHRLPVGLPSTEGRLVWLSKGMSALVDAEDYDRVVAIGSWHAGSAREGNPRYAVHSTTSRGQSIKILMHRFIAGAGAGQIVDHINGDTFDNRKSNLRLCDRKTNARNRGGLQRNNTTGVTGVYRKKNRFVAWIEVDGKTRKLGVFKSLEHAAAARKDAETIYWRPGDAPRRQTSPQP